MAAWTELEQKTAADLWEGGYSGGEIANRLGKTRNAVIGKIHRLGLSGRSSKAPIYRVRTGDNNNARKTRRKRIKAVRDFSLAAHLAAEAQIARTEANTVPDLDIPEAERVRMADLEAHHCRWPYGDGPFTFCGKHRTAGSSYCQFHALRSAAPIQPARGARPYISNVGNPLTVHQRSGNMLSTKELAEFDKMETA